MNRKQLILLLAVLVVIGGAGLILLNQHKESWSIHEAKMGDRALPNFRPNDVAAIHVQGNGEITVQRSNNVWVVAERQNYPANFSQISDLLIKLKDLKVVQAETVGSSDLSRVNLDPVGRGNASGALAEFKDAQGKVMETILLGKKHMRALNDSAHSQFVGSDPDARYILLPSNPQEVLLVSNTLALLEPRPEAWLSKDFIKLTKVKSVSLMATNPADSWKISRESEAAPWVLADSKPGEVLENARVTVIPSMLSSPLFNDVAPPKAPSELGLDYPKVVTVETFDHFIYTLKFGAKTGDDAVYMTVAVTGEIPTARVPAADEKPEDKARLDQQFAGETKLLQEKLKREKALAPWVYLVNAWIFDSVTHDRAQILQGYQDKTTTTAEPVPTTPANNSLPGAPGWTPRVIK